MSMAHRAGVIEKAIGAGQDMVTATLTVMTMHGRTTVSMATPMGIKNGKATTTIMEMATTIVTSSADS
jgi:hypothetical protein